MFCLYWISFTWCYSQEDIDHINKEVLFINESIHGVLVLHRIYENFNQEINKYVDLPSHDLNNYSNEDLPPDVFDDPNKWFYDISPNQLFAEISDSKNHLSTRSLLKSIHTATVKINKDRLQLENTIKSQDLNQLSTIQEIYLDFEEIINVFKGLQNNIKIYDQLVQKAMFSNELIESQKQVYAAFVEIHFDIKKAVRSIGKNNQSSVRNTIKKIKKERSWLLKCINELSSEQEKASLKNIYAKIDELIKQLDQYITNPALPEEYNLFGKGYYYQNVVLLTIMNRYGNGYVNSLNSFFEKYDWKVINLTEEPHYLKIIYPETTPKDLLAKPPENITTISELKEVNLTKQEEQSPTPQRDDFFTKGDEKEKLKVQLPTKIVQNHTLIVDSLSFEIELYDHLIKDGDRVSINVNGEWIFNDISLEKEPQRIRLSIDPNKENFILVQAVNIGWRPPNTVGLTYRSNGKVENMLLKTDLNSSELINIKYRSN